MPFIKRLNEDFFIKDGRIVLSEQYMKENAWKFKKLTATRFSSALAAGPYSNPVKTWCQMVGIYYEDMDPIISKVGTTIEPKVREYVDNKYGLKFKSYEPKDYNWDVFHLDDKKAEAERILGGIPDGEAMDEEGNVIHDKNHPILEIKTMSVDKFLYKKVDGVLVLQKDENGMPIITKQGENKLKHLDKNGKIIIPIEYQYQLALYLYLRNTKYGMFAVCFTQHEDYKNPEACNVNERDIRIVKFEIDDSMKEAIEYAKSWYKTYIKGGYSPKLTLEDEKWLKEVKYE